jgi:predicted DNA-binding transcriptional regulator AlpA
MTNDLMTLDEVADRLRRTPAQLRWMRHNNTGPQSAKLAGRVMYRRSDVESWIEAQFEHSGTYPDVASSPDDHQRTSATCPHCGGGLAIIGVP